MKYIYLFLLTCFLTLCGYAQNDIIFNIDTMNSVKAELFEETDSFNHKFSENQKSFKVTHGRLSEKLKIKSYIDGYTYILNKKTKYRQGFKVERLKIKHNGINKNHLIFDVVIVDGKYTYIERTTYGKYWNKIISQIVLVDGSILKKV